MLTQHRAIGICLLLAGVSLLAQLVFLEKYPALFVDESWFSGAVWHWVTTGENVDYLHLETLPAEARGKTRFYLGQLPWWLSFRLFGLGFFQARVASFLVGIGLLLAVFQLARQTYGALTGALAVLLLSLDPSFVQASHYARQDILLALFGVGALSLALAAHDRQSWWLHVAAGVAGGLTLEIHQNGIVFILALGGLYLWRSGRRFLVSRPTWYVALGGLAGCSVFVTLHMLPSPTAYLDYNAFDLARDHTPPLLSGEPLRMLKALLLERHRLGFESDSFGVALMVAALLFVAWRGTRTDRSLLVFTGASFLAFVLLVGKKSFLYAILTTPFLILLLAEMLVSSVRSARGSPSWSFARAALVVLLALRGFGLADSLYDHRRYDYQAASLRIAQAVPDPTARIMALPTWWLGLRDYEFTSSINLVHAMKKQGSSFAEAMSHLAPEVLVVDDQFRGNLVEVKLTGERPKAFEIPIGEYRRYHGGTRDVARRGLCARPRTCRDLCPEPVAQHVTTWRAQVASRTRLPG